MNPPYGLPYEPPLDRPRASDMFSFGVLLVQALTGDFTARPDALLARLGDAERGLLNQLLQKDPSKRCCCCACVAV